LSISCLRFEKIERLRKKVQTWAISHSISSRQDLENIPGTFASTIILLDSGLQLFRTFSHVSRSYGPIVAEYNLHILFSQSKGLDFNRFHSRDHFIFPYRTTLRRWQSLESGSNLLLPRQSSLSINLSTRLDRLSVIKQDSADDNLVTHHGLVVVNVCGAVGAVVAVYRLAFLKLLAGSS
jgi:hypothetical protein